MRFDSKLIEAAKNGRPAELKNPFDIWSVRPRQLETRYVFDRGPGKEIAEALIKSLDREQIFAPKPGKKTMKAGEDVTFETHGIDAYDAKTSPETGFFGFHRGSFTEAHVLILADPLGLDDWNTSRALTGARGQYLHGLMNDLGCSSALIRENRIDFHRWSDRRR